MYSNSEGTYNTREDAWMLPIASICRKLHMKGRISRTSRDVHVFRSPDATGHIPHMGRVVKRTRGCAWFHAILRK